jgi:glycosyltransferase involved in cell wall biosynthesis
MNDTAPASHIAGGSNQAGDRAAVLLVVEQLRRAVPGGIGTYAKGLLHGLGALSAGDSLPDVSLYASRRPARGYRHGADPLASFGFPLLVSAFSGPVLTRAWDRAMVRAPRGFDVVHALALAAPRPRGAIGVMTVHDLAWRHFPEAYPSRGRRWHEAAFERALALGSHLVVPSEAIAAAVRGAGAAADAVSVIAHGSDHLPEPDGASTAALLARCGVQGDFVLAVGTLEPRKNLSRLLEAFSLARPSLPAPWSLVVVGPSGWGPTTHPRPGVVCTGPVADATLAGLYARARMLVYIPLEEGFGLPPVEAMRVGTPVVASALPSVGDAVLEVDPLRVDDIADGIVRVGTDDAQRLRLTAAGRVHTADLTWNASARAHVALWEALARRRRT